jgi:DNA modification methylase
MGLPEGETSSHPTVKPLTLMRYLVRLITPPGGTVLDPFAGSGTTGMACVHEDFDAILIEREDEYVEIARRRVAAVVAQREMEIA